jgi:hypothetical protein
MDKGALWRPPGGTNEHRGAFRDRWQAFTIGCRQVRRLALTTQGSRNTQIRGGWHEMRTSVCARFGCCLCNTSIATAL